MALKPLMKIAAPIIAVLVLVVAFWDRGYGEVSPLTYEFSKALYGACQTKSDQRVRKVDALIGGKMGELLPANERSWLEEIIARAKNGDWEVATRQARRMLEDQVKY